MKFSRSLSGKQRFTYASRCPKPALTKASALQRFLRAVGAVKGKPKAIRRLGGNLSQVRALGTDADNPYHAKLGNIAVSLMAPRVLALSPLTPICSRPGARALLGFAKG